MYATIETIFRIPTMQKFKIAVFAVVIAGVMATAMIVVFGSKPKPVAAKLTVSNAWARAPSRPGLPAEVFFTVKNGLAGPDILQSAKSPVSRMEDIVRIIRKGDPNVYELAAPVQIPQTSEVSFDPDSYAITLNLLNSPVAEGDVIQITLQFRVAGPITIDVPVLGPLAYGN
jgi:copper(I)-binding protein